MAVSDDLRQPGAVMDALVVSNQKRVYARAGCTAIDRPSGWDEFADRHRRHSSIAMRKLFDDRLPLLSHPTLFCELRAGGA